MSNIDLSHGYIALDAIAELFPEHSISLETRLEDLPFKPRTLWDIHQKLGTKFSNGMPEFEKLLNAETVDDIVFTVVNSISAWRRLRVARHMARQPSLLSVLGAVLLGRELT